ncbi:MAG: hypothetical protein RLZ98_1837 [Pseudomonadota bacterium]|jgi:tripartite-type tricarboxylate transporter receptor subunit TctC
MQWYRVSVSALTAMFVAVALDAGDASEDFAGKTITIAVGSAEGGSYDAYARLTARHLGKHIPGNPSVVPKNMPGAAGTRVANYVYSVAPKDGTYLGATLNSVPLTQIMQPAKAKYESAKFNWIGALNSPANVLATWHAANIRTIEDAKKREVLIGATTAGTTMEMYPLLANRFLGTKFKVVLGYRAGKGVNLAMERGEVEGRGSNSWLSYKMQDASWVEQNKLNVLFQMTLKRDDDLKDVPTLIELAANDEDRQAIAVLAKTETIGRSVMAPPGVPKDTVATLRKAFETMLRDKEMLADASKAMLEIKPIQGLELQEMVESIFRTPQPIMEKFLAAVRTGKK